MPPPNVEAVVLNNNDGVKDTKKSSQFTNYTALNDLMVTKPYLRASEDSIADAKQKIHTFRAKKQGSLQCHQNATRG